MYKGIVTKNYLNIRVSGPNRDHPPLKQALQKGTEIEIKNALYGEEIDGENLWYKLTSNHYVWAGYVFTENDIEIQKKRIIFTADDYGVVDSIDSGIIKGVKDGLLNSVTCFTNYGENGEKALKKLRKLEMLQASYQLELGVHLTITSGSPLLGRGNVPLLCRDKKDRLPGYKESDFCDYTKLKRHYEKLDDSQKANFIIQLEAELRKQIEVFLNPQDGGNPILLSHLTSHHNSLLFREEFFEVMLKLSKEYKVRIQNDSLPIPLRSLHNIPGWKDNGFYTVKGKILFPKKSINKLKRKMRQASNSLVKTPSLLHSNHYGPPPFILKKNIDKLVEKKKNKSNGMLKDLINGDFTTMEFLLHLRSGKLYQNHDDYEKNETRPTGYAGINPTAFDSRTAELTAFLSRFARPSSLPPEIEMGTWANL